MFRRLTSVAFLSVLSLALVGCGDPHEDAADQLMVYLNELEQVLKDTDIDKSSSAKEAAEKLEALEERVKDTNRGLKGEKLSDGAEEYIEDEIEDDFKDKFKDILEETAKLVAKNRENWNDDLADAYKDLFEELDDLSEDLELDDDAEDVVKDLQKKQMQQQLQQRQQQWHQPNFGN